jgi:hypothetical protein
MSSYRAYSISAHGHGSTVRSSSECILKYECFGDLVRHRLGIFSAEDVPKHGYTTRKNYI